MERVAIFGWPFSNFLVIVRILEQLILFFDKNFNINIAKFEKSESIIALVFYVTIGYDKDNL